MTALIVVVTAPGAVADETPKPDPSVGHCYNLEICTGVTVPDAPGHDGGGQAGGASGHGSDGDAPLPKCIVEKLDPQPPAGSSLWEGHKPSEGAIYIRDCGSLTAHGDIIDRQVFWADQPPAGNAVDPALLAQQAVDKMKLTGADIGITPNPGKTGVVGMPVWMWSERGPTTTGPNTASATAGGVTVTATAKVKRFSWAMGDGKTITCAKPGTPYKAAFGKKASPDCGHVYRISSKGEPGGTYRLVVTSTWDIQWAVTGAGGEAGAFTETRSAATTVAVGQLKVLN
ncbi:ATP/GTP-binding protein [Streptomyces sp. T-3]|nr:ATP/GTP-binding protein [Streptomyces sp. T-3]